MPEYRFYVVRSFLIVTFLVLAGCTVAPALRPDATLIAVQSAREQRLMQRPNWILSARLAVSDSHDGGSGSLEWRQTGDDFRFTVHAPVTGKTWTLTGNNERVVLEGLKPQPIIGANASALLEQELGWHVPIAELTFWVRGVRALGLSDLHFRPDGLPAELEQAGWKVRYLDYDTTSDPPLPKKVFASYGDYRVRMVIQQWTLQ